MDGNEGVIVGIIEDFNFKSLHQKIEPLNITHALLSFVYPGESSSRKHY